MPSSQSKSRSVSPSPDTRKRRRDSPPREQATDDGYATMLVLLLASVPMHDLDDVSFTTQASSTKNTCRRHTAGMLVCITYITCSCSRHTHILHLTQDAGPSTAPANGAGATATAKTRTGGVYIPPFKLAQMMREVNDKSSPQYQRLTWDALRKSINGLINKVNASNIKHILPEIFGEVYSGDDVMMWMMSRDLVHMLLPTCCYLVLC